MQKFSFSVKIRQPSSLFRARLWNGAVAATVDPMEKKRRAAVVVLGDIGRSPRMQFHALSLARQVYFLLIKHPFRFSIPMLLFAVFSDIFINSSSWISCYAFSISCINAPLLINDKLWAFCVISLSFVCFAWFKPYFQLNWILLCCSLLKFAAIDHIFLCLLFLCFCIWISLN